MQIKLNKNSWHYRSYTKFISDDPPKSLCPYFWIMFGLVIIYPFIFIFKKMFTFLELMVDLVDSFKVNRPKKQKKTLSFEEIYLRAVKKNKRYELIGKISFIFLMIFFGTIFIAFIYITSQKIGWFQTIINLFAFIGFIGSIVVIVFFALEYEWEDKIKNKIINLSIVKMVKEIIVASYKKSCPIIKWEDDFELESTKQ